MIIMTTILTACGGAVRLIGTATALATPSNTANLSTFTPLSTTSTPTVSPTPTTTDTPIPSATPDARIPPERWREWPVVPTVQPEMKMVFQHGIELGNNPRAFVKIGDGEISTVWFLTQYDQGPSNYHLGSYTDLKSVIDNFSGSFSHVGLAAGRGFTTTIILGRTSVGTPECKLSESRLDCELRIFRPSFAIISLGTNQVSQPEVFEPELRQITKRLLEVGVVPILSTKADNLEGNYQINRIIVQLAHDDYLPLWNFWRAVQPLPNHGLQVDNEHLSYAYSDFGDPNVFRYAWPWRNLTVLQVLDSVSRAVTGKP